MFIYSIYIQHLCYSVFHSEILLECMLMCYLRMQIRLVFAIAEDSVVFFDVFLLVNECDATSVRGVPLVVSTLKPESCCCCLLDNLTPGEVFR